MQPHSDANWARCCAPLAGQHTREVLAEAGLAEAEIARLEAAGTLTSEPEGCQ